MTPDHRILITKMAAELDQCHRLLMDDRRQRHPLADRARAALADGPAVPEGREPASVVSEPSDRELLELMPETMRDEFAYAATTCSDATGGQVKPRIFRVCLNTAALEYARAALARWGRSAATPVPASERPWERDGWCDEQEKCWWGRTADEFCNPDWHYATRAEVEKFCSDAMPQASLPAHALPTPEATNE